MAHIPTSIAASAERKGRTTARTGIAPSSRPLPQLPHERDQSTDLSAPGRSPRGEIKQAKHDVDRGLKDTDRGPPMDETYQRVKRK